MQIPAAADYVLTLLAPSLEGEWPSKLAVLVEGCGFKQVDVPHQLSTDADAVDSVELYLAGDAKAAPVLRPKLLELATSIGVDAALQPASVFRQPRGLIAFDMDSTLIQNEVIDELARAAGVYDQVAAMTAATLNAKQPFKESLIARVKLLEGLPVERFNDVAAKLKLTDGAKQLLAVTRAKGMRSAIFSGGFRVFAEPFQKQLGIDFVHAHDLEVADNKLTGRVHGEIIDAETKRRLLLQTAAEFNLLPEQTIAVGDGANDIPMLQAAGLGIAFHAKPAVRGVAECALDHCSLDSIPYLFGLSSLEQRELLPHHI